MVDVGKMANSLLVRFIGAKQSYRNSPIQRQALLTEVSYLMLGLSETLAGSAETPASAAEPRSGPSGLAPAAALNLALKLAGVVEGLVHGMVEEVSASAVNKSNVTTIEAGGIRLTAASLAVSPLSPQQVSMPTLPLARDLPVSALLAVAQASGENSSIGITSVRWKSVNPFGPATVVSGSTQQAVHPAGDVVSLTLTSAGGKPLVVKDLAQPIVLAIPAKGKSQDVIEQLLIDGSHDLCRWFNETSQTWEGDGCRTLGLRKGGTEVVCSCTHLTTFGAFPSPVELFGAEVRDFFEGIVEVLLYCASASALLSAAGLAAVGTGAWATLSAASFVFILMSLLGVALIASRVRDLHDRQELLEVWADLAHVRWFEFSRVLGDWWKFFKKPSSWPSHFVRSFINLHLALRLGICQGTLDIIEEAQRAPEGYAPLLSNTTQRSAWSMTVTVIKAARHKELLRVSVIDDFTLRSLRPRGGANVLVQALLLLRRMLKLWLWSFIAVHPLTGPVMIDIDTLASHRTLVLTVELLGSIWCTALYFHASGTSSASWSPDECVMSGLDGRLKVAIPVGVVSTLVASVPSMIIYNMVGARPSTVDRQAQQASVVISHCLFYLVGLGLCSFYLMYLASFLANVSAPSADYWVLSAVSTVLSSLVVAPFLKGSIFSTILVIILWRAPNLPQKIFETEREDGPERAKGEEKKETETPRGHRVIHVREAAARTGPSLPGEVHGEEDNFGQILPCP